MLESVLAAIRRSILLGCYEAMVRETQLLPTARLFKEQKENPKFYRNFGE
jgi:hypothetical protein